MLDCISDQFNDFKCLKKWEFSSGKLEGIKYKTNVRNNLKNQKEERS